MKKRNSCICRGSWAAEMRTWGVGNGNEVRDLKIIYIKNIEENGKVLCYLANQPTNKYFFIFCHTAKTMNIIGDRYLIKYYKVSWNRMTSQQMFQCSNIGPKMVPREWVTDWGIIKTGSTMEEINLSLKRWTEIARGGREKSRWKGVICENILAFGNSMFWVIGEYDKYCGDEARGLSRQQIIINNV